ncbi:cell wall hydrolase [Neobacillus pocheonensis]|uniref:Cell wall hydrolase n=1 Tax=Neobacillus pocheonensis TaxID=363869 RepID=A0ABT0W6R8_9BACI|nr:cell wall hydrolase [Neobacillus pocheonensis]
MNKLKKLVIAAGVLLSMSAFTLNSKTDAASFTHKVQSGETYWKIAKGLGVPINSLEAANHWSSLYAGKNIVIPNSPFTAAQKELMARLVHAEAVGEPYAGKVAVATVILNRIKSPDFPSTLEGVVYQISNGHYAFTPVQNGQINQPADGASKEAVNEAIAIEGKGKDSLFYYNPKTSTNSWILSRHVVARIGNHVFAK